MTWRSLFIVIILINSSVIVVSAEDTDGDGVSDQDDMFPNDASEWEDSDGDGYGDNSDSCPLSFGISYVDVLGCSDTDEDGYSDQNDMFPNDSTEWEDSDGDGFGDNSDAFYLDASEWEDSDGDGIGDNSDYCPTVFGEFNGCPDTDGDGVNDLEDVFPDDPTQWSDADMDGYGDNAEGNSPDSCPYNFGTSFSLIMQGCPDSDGDGYADPSSYFTIEDGADSFPNDPSRWGLDDDFDGVSADIDLCLDTNYPDLVDENGCDPFQLDNDSDGVSNYYDKCENTTSLSAIDTDGCSLAEIDSDKDGFSDQYDAFPLDPNEWDDIDGDGFGDNSDSCPFVVGNSYLDVFGCPDLDGDGISDYDKLLWGADSLNLPNNGQSDDSISGTEEFDMSKESEKICVVKEGFKVCIQLVLIVKSVVNGETSLDLQIVDNLDGTSDITVNSDFDVETSELKIKPELRVSFQNDYYGVNEEFPLPFPTPNQIYSGQTYNSILDLYFWDEFLVLKDTFDYDDETNRIEIASIDLAPIITEYFSDLASTSPIGRVVSVILDEAFNLRIPLSIGFYVDTTSQYNTVTIGILDGVKHIESDNRCINTCTAKVDNNNSTSSLSVYTFTEGTVSFDIGGYLTLGIEIDVMNPVCYVATILYGGDTSNCFEVNKYQRQLPEQRISLIYGESTSKFNYLVNEYTFAVRGCTDSEASNQNLDASYDDGTCEYPDSKSLLSNSTLIYAGGSIGILIFAIIIVFLLSRRTSNSSESIAYDQLDSPSKNIPLISVNQQQENPNPSMKGTIDEKGYEWIQFPQGTWYWRNQNTGEWVLHERK